MTKGSKNREELLLQNPLFRNDMNTLGVTELEFAKALTLIICRHTSVMSQQGGVDVDWGFDFEAALQDVNALERRIYDVTTEWDDLKIGAFIANWQVMIDRFCKRYDVEVDAKEDGDDIRSFKNVLRRMQKVLKTYTAE